MVIGEVCNFSAYAFAPAILVTPLGALSVLIGAVLGSYFLGERLGVLGRVGCAICLVGSVVIVLHAPPDKELANIDELLQYVLSFGRSRARSGWHRVRVRAMLGGRTSEDGGRPLTLCDTDRFPPLRLPRHLFRCHHDLLRRAQVRQAESHDLHLHLLDCRIDLHHGYQRARHSTEDDLPRRQSVLAPVDLRLRDHGRGVHPNTNELLQQGSQPI